MTSLSLPDTASTRQLGAKLAAMVDPGSIVWLSGDLGAGKTTFVQGFAGDEVPVASPSYTLVNVYETRRGELWHVDLYRMGHPSEVHELGLDVRPEGATLIIEWPERAEQELDPPDVWLELAHVGDARSVQAKVGSLP